VCPWNRKAPAGSNWETREDLVSLDPIELLSLSPEEFRQRFRGTALTRARRRGLLRNAVIVLGNRGGPESLPALQLALHDEEELVREAARWAIDAIRRTRMHTDSTDFHGSNPRESV
jgi:epoxyqueuosine reductase